MSWIYRISMKMKLFIALLPLLLALIWLGGSGIAERIAAERQMDNMATLTSKRAAWCMNCKKNGE